MSAVRVELVHRVIAQINDVSLVATKTPTGIELFMTGGNNTGDSIILTEKGFGELLAEYNAMLSNTVKATSANSNTEEDEEQPKQPEKKVTKYMYSGRAEPSIAISKPSNGSAVKAGESDSKGNHIVPRSAPNKKGQKKSVGWTKENPKIEVNSCNRWTTEEYSKVATILLSPGGTWFQAAESSGRTPKAINVKAWMGVLPGIDYKEICKTAGPLTAPKA